MPKQVIRICYILWMLIEILAVIIFAVSLANYNQDMAALSRAGQVVPGEPDPFVQASVNGDWDGIIAAIIVMTLGGILGMISWIGTLVNLSRMQAWTWFILTFFFGVIMVFIYLARNPQPVQAQLPPLAQQAGSQFSPVPFGVAAPGPQPQTTSALEILRQRYARGEIDAVTFHQMRAQLDA